MTKKRPAVLVRKTLGFGSAEKGRMSCIEIEDGAGVHATIMIPHQLEGDFLARFQAACLHSAETRGQSPDPQIEARIGNPRRTRLPITEARLYGLSGSEVCFAAGARHG